MARLAKLARLAEAARVAKLASESGESAPTTTSVDARVAELAEPGQQNEQTMVMARIPATDRETEVSPPAEPDEPAEAADATRDSLFVVVTRSEVEAGDTERVLSLLHSLTDTPEIARRAQGTVDLRFDGYDDEPDELFEIDEIRDYVGKLDDGFPYWLFFGDTRKMSLQTITQCFLPKFLTMDEQLEQIPRELNELLTTRWMPALDYIAEFAGLTPDEGAALHEAALIYYTKVPAQLQA